MRTIPIIGETRIDHGEPRLDAEGRAAELRRQLAARALCLTSSPGSGATHAAASGAVETITDSC